MESLHFPTEGVPDPMTSTPRGPLIPSPRAWDLIPKTLAPCHSLCCLHTQTLLELGASPDYKDSYGLTPLYHTAIVGGDPGCCELLLHEHATLCCPDENGWHEIHQVRGGGRRFT